MKIGLALSGVGVRGIAHAGVIKALQKHRVEVQQISGTVAGTLVGALYAKGACVCVEEIVHFFERSNLFHPRTFAFRQAEFINSSFYRSNIAVYSREQF
jgi:NTE family protein